MNVRVTGNVSDLASDLRKIAVRSQLDMARVVLKNAKRGNGLAQTFAKQSSGPHGLNYFKRISFEMTGLTRAEYGPTGDVVGNAVGAGWRHGPPNNDLEKSQDVIGPAFEKDVRALADGWFWAR